MIVSSRLYLDAPTLPGAHSMQRREFVPRLARMLGGMRPLARLADDLHAVRCQTCHDELGDVAEICLDLIIPVNEMTLTLHHPTCRASDSMTEWEVPLPSAATAVAAAVMLPDGVLPMASRPSVAVVVNPSCERVAARQIGVLKRARNIALEDLRPLGFTSPIRKAAQLTGIWARLTGGRLVIDAPTTHQPLGDALNDSNLAQHWKRTAYGKPLPALAQTWTVTDLPSDVMDTLESTRELLVIATTRYLPSQLTEANLSHALSQPGSVAGMLRLA